MKKARAALLFLIVLITPPLSGAETLRVGVFSLKNFGDSKVKKPARLKFIAERIAELAVKGICVVDELQDADASAMAALETAITSSAHTAISAKYSIPVGSGRKEQFGFYWNPTIVAMTVPVQTILYSQMERDPGFATFKAAAGFDFTICAFHTRPSGLPLKAELRFLDDIFRGLQNMSASENDIIFVGDFNAPPWPRPTQSVGIIDAWPTTMTLNFAITTKPTNLIQKKIFDNIFFDAARTSEYLADGEHVVPIFDMLGQFGESIPGSTKAKKLSWFRRNVVDHCPIYADFRADLDTD